MHVGKRIKELRSAQKMTLTQLATKSGVQIATLSRMENLKMTGTLESHMDIAKALGIDLTQLYKDIQSQAKPTHPLPQESSPESFAYNAKASYEIVANNVLSKKMMPIVLQIDKGGKTNMEQYPGGSERFIFVLEGKIQAVIAEKKYNLEKNSTLYFDGSMHHSFTNIGKGTAKAILVTTPVGL